MALVAYSDSEASDDESPVAQTTTISASTNKIPTTGAAATVAPTTSTSTAKQTGPSFSSLVSRDNPRKIKIALPEIKNEGTAGVDGDGGEDGEGGPARKKVKVNGGGGGLFSGFNSLLPAPKKIANSGSNAAGTSGTTARKVFSLKTGAAPGFDRGESNDNISLGGGGGGEGDGTSIQKPPYSRENGGANNNNNKHNAESLLKEEEFKKKGNAMMFKPLSVARSNGPQKKKKVASSTTSAPTTASSSATETHQTPRDQAPASVETASATPEPPSKPSKPKVSLFSFSNSELSSTPDPSEGIINPSSTSSGAYESIVYQSSSTQDEQGPSVAAAPDTSSPYYQEMHSSSSNLAPSQTLDDIASDLNLSRAQRRQLLGRNPQAALTNTQVRTFQTDAEYAANQEFLAKQSEEEIAAAQHNPVRGVAPGKHTLKQLINVAQSQKDALEESFATGKRNKKEAGSRYGW